MANKTPPKASQIRNAKAVLHAVGFGVRQSNEMAALVLLALLDLKPRQAWAEATAPLRGITPIIGFISDHYGTFRPTRAAQKPSPLMRLASRCDMLEESISDLGPRLGKVDGGGANAIAAHVVADGKVGLNCRV
jgi:hypothetical protein